jgi:hypothetical protein
MADITSANSKLILQVPDVFPVPQVLQGYATDDAFASEEVDIAEVVKGVDGILSSGYIPAIYPMLLSFQADSLSIPNTMEAWRAADNAAKQKFFGQAVLLLPSLGLQWQFINGVLRRITPFPHAKKVLQPVSYRIEWEDYNSSPMA